MATHFLIGASSRDGDEATANILATDLEDSLSEAVPALTISRRREDPLAQDFGATLAVVLGTSAVTALAKGVAAWLARRQDARLVLRRTATDGQVRELTIDGQIGGRAERVIAQFFED
jgi:hypothetical protein